MYCVWTAYLEGTVQVTQSRISACDNYKVQVADPAKTVRLQKEQQLRKVLLRFQPLACVYSQLHFPKGPETDARSNKTAVKQDTGFVLGKSCT